MRVCVGQNHKYIERRRSDIEEALCTFVLVKRALLLQKYTISHDMSSMYDIAFKLYRMTSYSHYVTCMYVHNDERVYGLMKCMYVCALVYAPNLCMYAHLYMHKSIFECMRQRDLYTCLCLCVCVYTHINDLARPTIAAWQRLCLTYDLMLLLYTTPCVSSYYCIIRPCSSKHNC